MPTALLRPVVRRRCGWTTDEGPRTTGDRRLQPKIHSMATVGFPLFPFRRGTFSRQSYALSRVEPDPRLHINTKDAAVWAYRPDAMNVLIEDACTRSRCSRCPRCMIGCPKGPLSGLTMEQAVPMRLREARNATTMTGQGKKKSRSDPSNSPKSPHQARDQLQPIGTAIPPTRGTTAN